MMCKFPRLCAALALLTPTGLATSCQDVSIPVNVKFSSTQFPLTLTTQSLTADYIQNVVNLPTVTTTGEYQIAATFCEPTANIATRRNTLQILSHGIESNRTYWSALGFSSRPQNNYVEFASNKGYTTLSIDRLCNGLSSHPNGLLECQLASEGEVLHQIILKARAGTLPIGTSSRKFKSIITVGHSMGSSITRFSLFSYPNDADATILTGFSTRFIYGLPALFLYCDIQPTKLYKPQTPNIDLFYVSITKKSGFNYINYYGDYDPALADADFQAAATSTFGEALTASLATLPNAKYVNPVFLANGEQDPFYCQPNAVSALTMNPGNCSLNVPSEVKAAFPNVPDTKYGFYITKNTGHSVNLHRTAPQTFGAIFKFLDAQGF